MSSSSGSRGAADDDDARTSTGSSSAARRTDPADSGGEENNESEESLTLQELVDEEESLQADAAALLGASDAKSCSYIKGYVDRQALYACATCSPETSEAGICLACSYACHDGHELYELYTKRNFRCDCGNSKFPNMKCTLFSAKTDINSENSYNQNFSGKYCRCSRPYPDPERKDPEEMLQCVVCEDWFHLSHIGLQSANSEDFEELICDTCMKAHPFLWRYNEFAKKQDVGQDLVDVTGDDAEPSCKRPRCDEPNTFDKPVDAKGPVPCVMSKLPLVSSTPSSGAIWPKSWRRLLCFCDDCKEMYGKEKLAFLACADDTIGMYEERGLRKRREDVAQGDPLMTALNKMDHVAKIDLIYGYNNFKSCLVEFLREQANQKKVVTARDIHDFFEEMQKKKKKSSSYLPL